MRESTNAYDAVNTLGYLGKYQFGKSALQDIGFYDKDGNWTDLAKSYGVTSKNDFLNNASAQEVAIGLWFSVLWGRLEYYGATDYVGQTISGILITESGLLAAAHLIGAKGLSNALKANDLSSISDGYGTEPLEYMKLLGGYNVDEFKKR
jgi:hypothetical protein